MAPWSRQSVWRRGSPQRAPKLVATDVNVARVQEATATFDATAVEPETIVMAKCDVLSPNALGAILDDDTIPRLHARVIAGAAASGPEVKAAV